jgi:hypothetical protein
MHDWTTDDAECLLLDFVFGLDPLDAQIMTLLAHAEPWW